MGTRIVGVLNAAVAWSSDIGAASGQCVISVGPAPSNNRLKLPARGAAAAESRLRTRAAA